MNKTSILLALIGLSLVGTLIYGLDRQAGKQACCAPQSADLVMGRPLDQESAEGISAEGSYCTRLSACSVDKDLSCAKGSELQEYLKEKSLDGKRMDPKAAPNFVLPDTAGNTVSLEKFRGGPVAVVFLAVHCNHSMDTLPILAKLKAKYGPARLTILPVYVHSGSVSDIKELSNSLGIQFPLLVADKGVSKTYGTRMIPSTFLINDHGQIMRRLVGFKNEGTLDQEFESLISATKTAAE